MFAIRVARPDDLPELAGVYAEAEGAVRAGLGGTMPRDPAGLVAWLGKRLAGAGGFWVAALATGRIAGFVEAGATELNAIYVLPEAWGRGVASGLHDHAVAHMRASGLCAITLLVMAANGRARRFYERHGWRLAGDAGPRTVGGVEVAFVSYELALR